MPMQSKNKIRTLKKGGHMQIPHKHKGNSRTAKKKGNPAHYVSTLFYNAKQMQMATYEHFAEIAIAICTNPDCVDELSIMDLIRIHLSLFNFSHPAAPPNLIIIAGALVVTRLDELQQQTGLNFGIDAMEIAEIEARKAHFREAAKNAIRRFNEADYWGYP